MLDAGTVIAGKLRIERILGRGGMGIVAEATHLQLDQRVAVKVMRDEVASDPSTIERFMREARAAAKLRSEHVCRVSDVGQLDSGAPYIVMELLAGTDLAHLVAQAPLSVPTAIDHVLQACIAIAEAHVLGIVHRDLKPANLFLTKHVGGAPLVKVLDFGIAKAPARGNAVITATESVMGSPGYMSPEQLRSSRDVDARTDIWALGVILYQLVSQRLPFPAASVTELAVKVAMDPPEPLEGDPAFVAIVMRCIEKEPAARFRDVAALATALAPLGTESARRSLAVIEQLRPKPDSLASTMPAIDVSAPTGAPFPKTVTTLGGAATALAPTAAPAAATGRGRSLVLGGIGLAAAGSLAIALVLRTNPGPTAPAPAPAPPIVAAVPPDASIAVAPDAPPLVVESPPVQAAATTRPGTPPPAGPGTKAGDWAAIRDRFDAAIAVERCREASRLWETLKHSGTPAAAMEEINKQLSACLNKQADALTDQSDPGRIKTILNWAEELLDEKLAKDARELVENNILRRTPESVAARVFAIRAACVEKNGDVARAHAAKLPAGHAGVPICAKNRIDLTSKQPDEPTPDIPSDWKKQAEEKLSMFDADEALALAQVVLARRPSDQDALTVATRACCALGQTASARTYAAKLDLTHLAIAKKLGCDGLVIDTPAR